MDLQKDLVRKDWWRGTVAISLLALLGLGVFLLPVWAGDAVIHLRIAELTSQGEWFQFNRGEPVVATTSILWTLLLSAGFALTSAATTVWLVKIGLVLLWLLCVLLLGHRAHSFARLQITPLLIVAFVALNPGFFQNSVNGMEAILLAVEFLILLGMVFPVPSKASAESGVPGVVVGLMAFLCVLTRPEGVVFSFLLGAFLLIRPHRVPDARPKAVAVLLGAVLGVLLTVGIYRTVSHKWVPDSGAARMAAAQRESILIGPLMFHPKLLKRLFIYFPLLAALVAGTAGFFLGGKRSNVSLKRARADVPSAAERASAAGADRGGSLEGEPPPVTGGVDGAGTPVSSDVLADSEPVSPEAGFIVLLLTTMVVLYSFVLGAVHTSRYWIPFLPLQCLWGGLLWERLAEVWPVRRSLLRHLVLIGCLWLFSLYGLELYLRLRQGVGTPHGEVASAVINRPQATRDNRARLGEGGEANPLRLAVTEVQARYYLDDDGSIQIISLDGRSSASFKDYLEPKTGRRRFDKLLDDVQPHFVELGQVLPDEVVLGPLTREAAGKPAGTRLDVDGFRFEVVGTHSGMVRFLGRSSAP